MTELLTPQEAAGYLKISERTLRHKREEWGIPHLSLSHKAVRYRRQDLEAFIQRKSNEASQ